MSYLDQDFVKGARDVADAAVAFADKVQAQFDANQPKPADETPEAEPAEDTPAAAADTTDAPAEEAA